MKKIEKTEAEYYKELYENCVENELIDYAEFIEFNNKVEDAVFELEDLVDDLKSYQFRKNMNLIDIDCDELIEEVIAKITETIKKIEY